MLTELLFRYSRMVMKLVYRCNNVTYPIIYMYIPTIAIFHLTCPHFISLSLRNKQLIGRKHAATGHRATNSPYGNIKFYQLCNTRPT